MTTPLQEPGTNGALTREGILGISDLTSETCPVPEWGGSVLVQGLTGEERDEFEASCVKGRGRKAEVNLHNLRAKLVVIVCRDATGARLFTDDDAPALGRKSAAAINRIYEVGARLSGITEDDVEELLGNSSRGRPGASPSGSLARSA